MSRGRVQWSEGGEEPWLGARYIPLDPPLMMEKSGTIWIDASPEFNGGPIVGLIEYDDGEFAVYRGNVEPPAS